MSSKPWQTNVSASKTEEDSGTGSIVRGGGGGTFGNPSAAWRLMSVSQSLGSPKAPLCTGLCTQPSEPTNFTLSSESVQTQLVLVASKGPKDPCHLILDNILNGYSRTRGPSHMAFGSKQRMTIRCCRLSAGFVCC